MPSMHSREGCLAVVRAGEALPRCAKGRRNTLSSRTPTIRRRRLAAELRRLREAAGLTIDQVAEALECSSSKISRIETEQVSATPRDVRDMLSLYGVEGQQRDALLQVSREARQKGWWFQYRDLPEATLVGLEAAASSLRIWEPIRIPALFQTREYARASLRAVRPTLNAEDIERRVELRLAVGRGVVTPRPAPHPSNGADDPLARIGPIRRIAHGQPMHLLWRRPQQA
jgi:transcriptional regulator with XRE-family HTH domain